MNTHKIKLATSLFILAFLMPHTSQAYFTTKQNATKINDETVLFSISYAFGFNDRELYMPIMAVRNSSTTKQSIVNYTILDDQDTVFPTGVANSIILTDLSKAEVRGNQYYLEPGEAATFTLYTLLNTTDSINSKNDLSLLVTHLPFTTIKNEKILNQQLNPSELQYYRTPEVDL